MNMFINHRSLHRRPLTCQLRELWLCFMQVIFHMLNYVAKTYLASVSSFLLLAWWSKYHASLWKVWWPTTKTFSRPCSTTSLVKHRLQVLSTPLIFLCSIFHLTMHFSLAALWSLCLRIALYVYITIFWVIAYCCDVRRQ